MFLLRPLIVPAEYSAYARLLSESQPDWPISSEQLIFQAEQRDSALYQAIWVAEQDGQLLGVAQTGEDQSNPSSHQFSIHVHPKAQRQGIGSALFAQLEQLWESAGVRKLQCLVYADQRVILDFLHKRGFAEEWRSFDSRLATKNFDAAPFAELVPRLQKRGLKFATFADLSIDPECDSRLYELYWQLLQDVPSFEPPIKLSFEQWRNQELETPKLLSQASVVAIDPQRSAPYIGFSILHKRTGDFISIGMTGVLPEYRGLGVAKALKLHGILWVQRHGGREIRTFNDAPNQTMLKMNQQLGFVFQPARLRMGKLR